MNDNSIDLDLDALTSASKKIKLNGEIIEIFPPDVIELFKLMSIGKEIRAVDTNNMTEAEAIDAFEKMRNAFIGIIPELKDKKVSIDQLFAMLDLMIKMAIPNDIRAMEQAGIKIDSNEKKILSDGLEKSEDSFTTIQPIS